MKNRNKIKLDPGTRALRIISYVFVSIWALICLLPFILVISASFSTESIVAKEGFGLLPKGFTLSAYELVFRSPKMILGSYGVTIALTVCGTVVGLFIIAMTGYALQRKDFPFRNALSFFIYFTTLFSAGMAPTYIWVSRYLKLNGSYMAVFLQLLKPALATVGLFLALGYWNEWYLSSLYLNSSVTYKPLQYYLYQIINTANALKNSVAGANVSVADLPSNTLKMATAVVATGPIIFLYPFVQKYFISGITVGAVKG